MLTDQVTELSKRYVPDKPKPSASLPPPRDDAHDVLLIATPTGNAARLNEFAAAVEERFANSRQFDSYPTADYDLEPFIHDYAALQGAGADYLFEYSVSDLGDRKRRC
jgi:hypothetical protein